ncbi:MAG: 5-deoxy-glucuronate isomerase [Armatimonadetes bacterium]|nr:5-deoxy-glucuronate isomerase [Armatimonadota bacterium]
MSQLHRSPHHLDEGYTPIVSPANSALKLIELGRLLLGSHLGEHEIETGSNEMVVSLLSGSATIRVEGDGFSRQVYDNVGGRKHLFSDMPKMIYLPRGCRCEIAKTSDTLDAVVIQTPSKIDGVPALIGDENVTVAVLGEDGFTREVVTNVGDNVPASKLLVGECRTMSGQWGSYPPHKHDRSNPPLEEASEEVYFFQVDPPQGFGVQIVYTDPTDPDPLEEAYVVRNGDVIVIPRGYHPVATAPGYRLCYTWAIAGEKRKYGAWSNDADHEWILRLPSKC